MHTFISNLTYGLIATSCTVLFVCGGLLTLYSALNVWLCRADRWENIATALAIFLCGIAAIAIALHFTL